MGENYFSKYDPPYYYLIYLNEMSLPGITGGSGGLPLLPPLLQVLWVSLRGLILRPLVRSSDQEGGGGAAGGL